MTEIEWTLPRQEPPRYGCEGDQRCEWLGDFPCPHHPSPAAREGDRDMAYTYWQHSKSGEIFAIQTDEAGMAIGVTGPIAATEATVENYGDFDYGSEDADWANREQMQYFDPTIVR